MPSSGRTAVFTIVSRNYLPYARVLMQSLRAVHPHWDRFVLLADLVGGLFDPAQENFRVVEAQSLELPEPQKFFFRYTIVELNTAVKPWFFRRLFADGYDRVVYLDPDIFVYRRMSEIESAFEEGALTVLVPHLTGRISDTARPGEREILQSGAYNLGFCAMAQHRELESLLAFWCEKSVREFVVDLPRGLFTDQRWMDLVPGMFDDVRILRHEGYDVAYWNLPHRTLTLNGGITVNRVPLVFFHFSGIDPIGPGGFSKHQNRYSLENVGPAAELAKDYVRAVRANGLKTSAGWTYAYGFLRDGSPIPDVLRQLYRTTPEVEGWAGDDPFVRSCGDWNESIDAKWPVVTRVMLAVYQARVDIRRLWPDILGADRQAFVRWFAETPEIGQLVPNCYIHPARQSLRQAPRTADRSEDSRRAPSRFRPDLVPGALRKAAIAFNERRLPLSPRRWLQLYRLHVSEEVQREALSAFPTPPPMVWPLRASDTNAILNATPDETALTVVGYLADATGVAAGAHGSAAACAAAGIACQLVDARSSDVPSPRHPMVLFHVNADQMPIVATAFGEEFFRGRYTIGRWAWELEELPEDFLRSFRWLNEIWAMSQFVQRAVAEKSPIPVIHMPLPVTISPAAGISRTQLGLPADKFLFLMMYDTLSIQERKNPRGALEAFRRAFGGRSPQRVGIVIKVSHAASSADEVALVRDEVARTEGAILIDRPMSRAEAAALQGACDVYVSLHRSEGFGLNIAEAMLLGRPVIATGWSGNVDFTTSRNSCLVDYELLTLDRDFGPYRKGSRWADPDLDQAAAYMARLVEDAVFRREIALRGQQTVSTDLSPAALGLRYRRRLALIQTNGLPTKTGRF